MTDYERVERAIIYLRNNFRRQPSLEEIAAQVHLSPHHFQRLFARWAGVTPKRFVQALTLNAAKEDLRRTLVSPLKISEDLGLSSLSRLHAHFVTLDAVTPAEFRSLGENLLITYGCAESRFGDAWVASTERGICRLWFCDHLNRSAFLDDLHREWPQARLKRDDTLAARLTASIFFAESAADRPLSLLVRGTNFQVNVWRALLSIPPGKTSSYAQVARAVGKPKAVRAVGSAVGANPLSFVIPCHRVIRQTGELGGYRGGLARKEAMLAWERVQSGEAS